MDDPLRRGFDALPYRHGAIPHTHPARTGAVALLLGRPAAAAERCRVLELGCAEGGNLLPLAERLPAAEFVGVDFSPVHIARAEAARAACGIGNARFVCADLREFEPAAGAFDRVIAHGVYSWVPDEVKERLLALCARALAPGGIACVSYGVLPGWSVLAGLRAFLLAELDRAAEPSAQAARVGWLLEALARGLAGQPGGYAAALREAVAELRGKPPELLFHDELELVNDPCTFTRFTAHAACHGLHYLGEACFAEMLTERLPAEQRAVLVGLGLGFLREQQFLDAMFQRWLRNSLLVREPGERREPDPAAVGECAVGLRGRPVEPRVDLRPGVAMELRGPRESSFAVTSAAGKALLAGLAEAAPERLPWPEALRRATVLLARVGLPAAVDGADLRDLVVRMFARDLVDLVLAGDGAWLRASEPPAPSALMRYQAGRDPTVANRWHEPVRLTGDGARSLADPSFPVNPAALRQAGLYA